MVLGQSAGLVKLGHEVILYGYGGRAEGADRSAARAALTQAEEAGIETRTSTATRVPGWSPRSEDTIVSSLSFNRDGLDLLVVHRGFGTHAREIVRAARKGGVACIATLHDPLSPLFFANRPLVKQAYWRLAEAPLLRRMDAVHVLAPSHARYLRDLGVLVPAFAVPNGLDSALFESPTRGEQSLGPSSPTVLSALFLGRLDTYHKGLDILLRAIAEGGPRMSVRLQLAGRSTPAEEHQLRALAASLGLDDRVSFLGFLSDPKAAVREADVVVLPSRFDGFGLVVMEALVLGTPVIVSSQAGASEFVGPEHGAIVVHPDARSVARALQQAAESKHELRRAARSARLYFEREFKWDDLARKWTEEVERLHLMKSQN